MSMPKRHQFAEFDFMSIEFIFYKFFFFDFDLLYFAFCGYFKLF